MTRSYCSYSHSYSYSVNLKKVNALNDVKGEGTSTFHGTGNSTIAIGILIILSFVLLLGSTVEVQNFKEVHTPEL